MNRKSFYTAPQTETVVLENEGIMCQSETDTKYSTSPFEWDDAINL